MGTRSAKAAVWLAHVAQIRESGVSVPDMATALGVKPATVRRWVADARRMGLDAGPAFNGTFPERRAFDHDEAIRLCRSGVGYGELSKRFGTSRRAIQQVIKRARKAGADLGAWHVGGVPVGTNSTFDHEEAFRLAREGLTPAEIGRKMDVPRRRVRDALSRARKRGTNVGPKPKFGPRPGDAPSRDPFYRKLRYDVGYSYADAVAALRGDA